MKYVILYGMKYKFYKIYNNTGRLQVDGNKFFILRNGFLEKGAPLVAVLDGTMCYELNYKSKNLVYFDIFENEIVERGRFVMVGRNMLFMLEESSPYA